MAQCKHDKGFIEATKKIGGEWHLVEICSVCGAIMRILD